MTQVVYQIKLICLNCNFIFKLLPPISFLFVSIDKTQKEKKQVEPKEKKNAVSLPLGSNFVFAKWKLSFTRTISNARLLLWRTRLPSKAKDGQAQTAPLYNSSLAPVGASQVFG